MTPPAGYENRVKVLCEINNHNIFPKPDMTYFISPTVIAFACKDENKPDFFNLIESGKKIHLNTKRSDYDLENAEQKAAWENLDNLLRTRSTLTFYIKLWRPATEKQGERRKHNFNELPGDFVFDFAESPCITM